MWGQKFHTTQTEEIFEKFQNDTAELKRYLHVVVSLFELTDTATTTTHFTTLPETNSVILIPCRVSNKKLLVFKLKYFFSLLILGKQIEYLLKVQYCSY